MSYDYLKPSGYLPVFERWARELGLMPTMWHGYDEAIKGIYSMEKIVEAIERESPFLRYVKGGK